MGTLSTFAFCVINGEVSPLCGVFKDHYNVSPGITFGEAYKFNGVILLTGSRRRRQGEPCREGHPENQANGELSQSMVPWQVPLLGLEEYTSKRIEGISLNVSRRDQRRQEGELVTRTGLIILVQLIGRAWC